MAHKVSIFLALATGVALSTSTAHAATIVSTPAYQFSQTGFDGGGSLSGSFQGADANNDGWISTSEVSTFSLSFTGDSIVSDFSQGLGDLYILEYKIGSDYLGDEIDGSSQEVIGTNWFASTGFDYYSGIGAGGFGGAVSNIDTGEISRSDELVAVSAVPIPATVWLFGSSIISLLGVYRRKQTTVD